MNLALLLVLATATATATPPAVPQASPPVAIACPVGETPAFACRIGPRRLSICAAGTDAVLRISRRGRIEVKVRGANHASRMYSGGGEEQVIFRRGDNRYVVYDRVVRTGFGADGANDPAMTTGLLTQRGGRTPVSVPCRAGSVMGALPPANAELPAGEFVPH